MKRIFDDVDRKILSLLRENGRMSLHELAKETSRSSTAIRKRLLKLTKNNIIHTTTLINLKKFNFYISFIRLEVEDVAARDAIYQRFRDCPRLISLYSTLGMDNMIALMLAEDRGTLESEQMQTCAIRSSKGVRRSEITLITEIFYNPYLPMRIELITKDKEKAPCGANCAKCKRYKNESCLACPATRYYRGPL
ncbi:MAG: Lrp/AsnC family transcriptional regulator [Candidatus Helarchaeales archaeon]